MVLSESQRDLREMVAMLGWEACIGVAMLWAFFDESSEHDLKTGHAIRMTMGGCVASADKWLLLSKEWETVLHDFGVSWFRMADFEADQGEFKGWKESRPEDRKKLLNALLDLMINHVESFVGTFVEVIEFGQEEKRHYKSLVKNTLHSAALVAGEKESGELAVVFAQHRDFNQAEAEALAVALGTGPIIGSISVANPRTRCPLQAADIFAYELSRHLRFNSTHQRYPFMQIVARTRKRQVKVVYHLYGESFRLDPRTRQPIHSGTILPPPLDETS